MIKTWIDETKLYYEFLSKNPKAIYLLKSNPDKINWSGLSLNINDKAIDLLMKNQDKINWNNLCSNTNPRILEILENNKNKIVWSTFSGNPLIFEIDYEKISKNFEKLKEEIIIEAMNPKRIRKYLENEHYDYLEELYGY